MSKKQLTINLDKTTILFGIILLALGYFIGNTIPFGGQQVVVFDENGNIIESDTLLPSIGSGSDAMEADAGQGNGGTVIGLTPDDDPTIGDPNAPVQVYEFSDFQCPFCQRFYNDAVKQMETEYIDTGKVLFIYKDFPLQQIHPAAVPAAVYANCANEQGKFKEFHDNTFDNMHLLGSGQSGLDQLVEMSGLDGDALNACLENQDELLAEIQDDLQTGSANGVTGTPSIFIGNPEQGFTQIVGAQPYSVVKQTIESYL